MNEGNPFSWTLCGHRTQPTECDLCKIEDLRKKAKDDEAALRKSMNEIFERQQASALAQSKEYKKLQEHHIKESTELIAKVNQLSKECNEVNESAKGVWKSYQILRQEHEVLKKKMEGS